MDATTPNSTDRSEARTTAHTLRALMRYLWAAYRRKNIIIAAVIVSAVIGFVLYKREKPRYQASTRLLVDSSNADRVGSGRAALSRHAAKTFRELCFSDVILEGTARKLQVDPPEFDRSAPVEQWAGMLRGMLSLNGHDQSYHGHDQSNIVELACFSQDRHACVSVLNAWLESSTEFLEKYHQDASVELVKSLDAERIQLQDRLLTKERELQETRRKSGAISQDDKLQTVSHPAFRRVFQVGETFFETTRKRQDLESTLTRLRKAVQAGKDLTPHLTDLDAVLGEGYVATVLGMDQIQNLTEFEQKLNEEEARLDSLRQFYGVGHPKFVQVAENVRRNRESIGQSRAAKLSIRLGRHDPTVGLRLVNLVEESLINTRDRETVLALQYQEAESEASDVNATLAEVSLAEREVTILRKLHDTLLTRIAGIDVNDPQGQIRVATLTEPLTPGAPSSPNLSKSVSKMVMMGLVFALGVVYILEVLDDRFRTPEELKEQLGVPMLAMIRELPARGTSGLEGLEAYVTPDSVECEAFRTLRTTLAFSCPDNDFIAVSSTEPSDGKTTIVSNLAVSFAHADKRTLVIDADLRRPGLSRHFEMRGLNGLSEVLRREDVDMAEACVDNIQNSGMELLDIMPCGPKPTDPTKLLSHPRMGELLAWANAVYDVVLIDCPPISVASDAAIVGRLADGLALVVQPAKNHRRRVLRTVENIRSLGVGLTGIIANRVSAAKDSEYSYGYGSEYGYYGYTERDEQDDTDESEDAATQVEGPRLVRRRAA